MGKAFIITAGGNRFAKEEPTALERNNLYANSDLQLVEVFLRSRVSGETRKTYESCIKGFIDFLDGKPFGTITLDDALNYKAGLADSGIKVSTQRLKINTIKSLFAFGQKVGYLPVNVFIALMPPRDTNELAQRILTEQEVMAMILKTDKQRDRLLIRLLYATGARISEINGLTWAHVKDNRDTGQVTLFGKGGKTRAVKLSAATWKELQDFRGGAKNEDPVFRSQKGVALDQVQIHRIVKAAAARAGIAGNVSAHWLRHSHASHALDRGANIALVRDTLGHSSLAVTSRYTHAKPDQSSALHLAV